MIVSTCYNGVWSNGVRAYYIGTYLSITVLKTVNHNGLLT